MSRILETNDLHFYYGMIHAIKGINLRINEGEVVTLIGANGAGKTTTLRCISGILSGRTEGSVIFKGRNITGMEGYKIARLGILHVLEGRHIFPALTVKENLMMGAYLRKDKGIAASLDHVFKLFPRLLERQSQLGGTLSGGEQQMLAIARALMGNPEILLLDEPSLGLAPLIVKEIFEIIRKISNEGITILLVEQNSKAALSVSDYGYVLENGRVTLEGKCENLICNDAVKECYLGG